MNRDRKLRGQNKRLSMESDPKDEKDHPLAYFIHGKIRSETWKGSVVLPKII